MQKYLPNKIVIVVSISIIFGCASAAFATNAAQCSGDSTFQSVYTKLEKARSLRVRKLYKAADATALSGARALGNDYAPDNVLDDTDLVIGSAIKSRREGNYKESSSIVISALEDKIKLYLEKRNLICSIDPK